MRRMMASRLGKMPTTSVRRRISRLSRAKGLTTGEISAHFADVYGASVSKDTVSRITDRVIEEMVSWWARPLEKVYAAVFIDAIMVKIRDGQVRNRPIYAAIGVDLDGHKDILGMWAGDGDGESAKFWLAVLTDLKNRGVKDIFFVVCDGLKGLPDSVSAAFPLEEPNLVTLRDRTHLLRVRTVTGSNVAVYAATPVIEAYPFGVELATIYRHGFTMRLTAKLGEAALTTKDCRPGRADRPHGLRRLEPSRYPAPNHTLITGRFADDSRTAHQWLTEHAERIAAADADRETAAAPLISG